MAAISAGVMVFRRGGRGLEVLLVHPGGPFWKNKEAGAWSIPKGVAKSGEDLLAAAKREFEEETSLRCPAGDTLSLGDVRLASGKRVHAWAVEGDVALDQCCSNTYSQEWPPKSGKFRDFPEVDQWSYFTADEAKVKINQAQAALIDRLVATLKA